MANNGGSTANRNPTRRGAHGGQRFVSYDDGDDSGSIISWAPVARAPLLGGFLRLVKPAIHHLQPTTSSGF